MPWSRRYWRARWNSRPVRSGYVARSAGRWWQRLIELRLGPLAKERTVEAACLIHRPQPMQIFAALDVGVLQAGVDADYPTLARRRGLQVLRQEVGVVESVRV